MDVLLNPHAARALEAPGEFCGRAWFFEELDEWLSQVSPEPWLVTAEPGWGKSAVAREVAARIAGTLLWTGARVEDTARHPWSEEELENARLIVIDGLHLPQPEVDALDWVRRYGFSVPVLVLSRPYRCLARARANGFRHTQASSRIVENLDDITAYLQRYPLEFGQNVLSQCHGNFLVAQLLAQREGDSEQVILEVLWHLASSVVAQAPVALREDLYRVLCLLAESGEVLEADQFVDFLGLSAARSQELLSHLRPLLSERPGCQLFSPWLARAVSVRLLRDLAQTHASVIAFFRETYPSWDEMSDPYGWSHLGHHCDRYGRTGKKRDFSILHWLTEGPFIKFKLQKTRALASTLLDLRRGLAAALEEHDLPRIVYYGFAIPRLRREMSAPLLHELADQGELARASAHAELLSQESNRYLAFLLLAWQASDEGQLDLAQGYLRSALLTPLPELDDDDLPLVTCICASLLRTFPEQQETVLQLLELEENPLRTARNYLTLGLVDNLEDHLRLQALHVGRSQGKLNEFERLSEFVEKSLDLLKKQHPKTRRRPAIDEQEFVDGVTRLSHSKKEQQVVDGLFKLVDQALHLEPRPDWVSQRLQMAVQLLAQLKNPQECLRAVVILGRFLVDLGSYDETFELYEKLAAVANEIADGPTRCRALAELGVGFHRLGQLVRSNQLISSAASQAFRLEHQHKAGVLKFIAGTAGQVGNHARARDLAFNALEVLEVGSGPFLEVNCRGVLRQSVVANISDERSFEMLQMYADSCRRQEGIDPRIKALGLAAVAESAARLGYASEARNWLDISIAMARAADSASDRTHLLARLAVSENNLGERVRYERLMQESMEALVSCTDQVMRCEGFIALTEARHAVRDSRAHAVEKSCVKELSKLDDTTLLRNRTLLRLLVVHPPALVQSNHELQALLARARREAERPQEDRDGALVCLIRIELAIGLFENALQLAAQIQSTRSRSSALADISEALIVERPEQAVHWLAEIPLRSERLSALLRCSTRLATELRPSRQKMLQRTLAELTLLASEDEAVSDILLSRWISSTDDSRVLERTARKMGWIAEEPATRPEPATATPSASKGGLQPLTLRSV